MHSRFFDEELIKQCILNTFLKRIWGAWKVLNGEAGIIVISVHIKKFHKKNLNKGVIDE